MMNAELLKVIEEAKASGVAGLDLSNKELTALPPEIGQLINLTHLNLGDNQLTELPPEICQLTKLEKLALWNNKLTTLPQEIHQLTNLRQLNLSGNKLHPLPQEISQLKNLTHLDLSWNQLTELPPAIGQLAKIEELDLWGNQLTKLPQEIGQLTALKKLNLGHNQLNSLPSELSKLTCLVKLNLSLNKLSTLPPEFFQLTKLIKLELNDNKLTVLPPEISKLTCIEKLHLWDNQLSSLPLEIGQLVNLKELPLSHNQLASLPSTIGQLMNLIVLELNDNKLTVLPSELFQLTNLRTLNLYKNKLTTLPQEICKLNSLVNLYVNGNKLTDPPLEIARKGIEAIDEYFIALEKGKQPLNEVKIILVGEGSAGKTSLVKRLLGQPIDENENTTHGISIKDFDVKTGDQQIKVNIWDFGGQEIQHATHQFFLSKRSLYVLVLDGRKEERPEHWLRYIEAFGGDSPVLVVLNKIDANPSFDVNQAFLMEKYPSIRGFFRTSCKTDKGIAWFKDALIEELAKVEMIGIRWPKSWFAVKRRLEQMNKPYLSAEKYKGYCTEAGITEEESRETLIEFLHDLGVAVHFKDWHLKDTHALDPVWVTNGVYAIITAEKMVESKGFLHLQHLGDFLPQKDDEKHSYPAHTHAFILELMKKFELCYELDRETVLIPQLLPVSGPSFSFNYNDALRFALHYPDFLPPSVFPRFMVKVHKDIADELHWRTGVGLKDQKSGSQAVVKADIEARRINIWVNGECRRDYLHYLRYLLADINSSFEKLTVSERVPMPDDPARTADYETLRKCAERGIERCMPDGSDKDYSVHELLGLVQPKDKNELIVIPEKMGLQSAEKESFTDWLVSAVEITSTPPFINFNLTELFKQIRAWDKQRQRKASK